MPLVVIMLQPLSSYTLILSLAYQTSFESQRGGCCCLIAKSYPIFCDTMDYSPAGSSVHGISQARILEWVVISFSRGSSQPRDQTQVSGIADRFFTTEPLKVNITQSCPTLCNLLDCPWNSLGQNTGVGSLSLFQGVFPT